MATDRELSIRLSAINSLAPGLSSAEKAIKLFTGKSLKDFSMMKIGAVAAGAAVAAMMFVMAKRTVELDAKMVRMRITAGLSAKEMLEFKNQILTTGVETGNTGDDMTALAESALKSSNNIKFVRENLSFLAKVMNASGASAEELGTNLGEAFKKAGMSTEDFQKMIATLYSVSKATGREQDFTAMLPNLPKMIETFKTLNPKAGFKEIQDYLAQGFFADSPEAMNRALTKMMIGVDINQVKNKLGIKGTSLEEIMGGLKKAVPGTGQEATNKRLRIMKELFGKSAVEVQKLFNNWDNYQKAMKSADVNKLIEDANIKTESLAGQFAAMSASFDLIAGKAMGPALESFGKFLKDMKPEDIDAMTGAFSAFGKVLEVLVKAFGLLGKGAQGYAWGLKQIAEYQVAMETGTLPVYPPGDPRNDKKKPIPPLEDPTARYLDPPDMKKNVPNLDPPDMKKNVPNVNVTVNTYDAEGNPKDKKTQTVTKVGSQIVAPGSK